MDPIHSKVGATKGGNVDEDWRVEGSRHLLSRYTVDLVVRHVQMTPVPFTR